MGHVLTDYTRIVPYQDIKDYLKYANSLQFEPYMC